MSALGTEYFVLQSTASSTISESGSRVSIYLSSLASGLVALGARTALFMRWKILLLHLQSRSVTAGRFRRTDLTGSCLHPAVHWENGGEPLMSDLREVFNELIRFEIELWNAVDARLKREFDLPLTHFEPMSVMDRMPKCRVYDIAAELGITTGGTSKLVDRIEASGYCRRLPNPDDRRSSLLELTPEGKRMFAEAGKAFDDELQRRLGAAVPERTLRQFAATLARLRAAGQRAEMEESA
jgi:MarR family transcriptional regulator, organic hydroperoxide resistance regulator